MKDEKFKYLITIVAENLLGNKRVDCYGTKRFYRRMNECIVLDKNDSEYEKKKNELLKNGYGKLEYVFPRYVNDLNKINWFVYFVNPLRTILRKNFEELEDTTFTILFLSENNVFFDFITFNYKGVPVCIETASGNFNFLIECEEDLDDKTIVGFIGKQRSYGFGKCLISVKLFKNNK